MRKLTRHLIVWTACGLAAAAANADWLVTRAGERVETEGPWEVRGRMVVFTNVDGVLASIRLSEIDLDASRAATDDAAASSPAPAQPTTTAARSRRVITTEDVGEGTPGAEGVDLLIERLRRAHELKDVGLAMGLVNWQDVPDGMRPYIESQFEWMMGQRIRDVRFTPSDPEAEADDVAAVQDDVLYEPNVEVAGRLVVDCLPAPDTAEVRLDFVVGTRLGSYFLAAPREVPE